MKKRTLLLPLSMFALISCTGRPDADVRNKYGSEDDCLKDNPKAEIAQNLDDDDDFDPSKLCEKVTQNGESYYLGPAYPYRYYGHSGFYNGYWIGRNTYYSRGVIYQTGETFTHSQIASGGGVEATVGKAAVASSGRAAGVGVSGKPISRGGFGSYGHASIGG